jgi:polar amino acid transport system substrate-binding protein
MLLCAVICLPTAGYADGTDKTSVATGKTLRLCCPDEQWYPFLYNEDGVGKGMLVDIVKKACESAGFRVEIEIFPINRCLRMAEYEKADGIIGLPYDKKYATVVEYPSGSQSAAESVWRILQIDEVIITYRGSGYEYAGNSRTLPEPVRVLQGSPVTSELRQADLNVEELSTSRQLLSKLAHDKNGSVVTNTVSAEQYLKDESFSDSFDIDPVPLRSSSYYLAFSWKSELSREERAAIWHEVRRWRQSYAFMLKVFSQY